ncbi:hypothetical protein MIND_01217600 [Mycena indigotica]|uniref:F-box domain-containing protein n=1 Tax=Mycena indigotica TaxID=2126181 RepID=A0A8H6S3U5_9AGAR|nr:uncharacterized protein MIND_01217600 [Mycena indigotica]KAF7291922.1 hypothetical protein MIND_01217600 [Mycena indigotica]
MSNSPFNKHLETNFCPSDADISLIKELLVEPSAKLESITSQIAALNTKVESLQNQRKAPATFVAAHRALASPIRRMPDGVLAQIFTACLPTDRNCVMSASEPPLLFGRVCSRWRDLALRTPTLWCRVHVHCHDPLLLSWPPHSMDEDVSNKLELHKLAFVAWIARSGDCPLSISIHRATPSLLDILLSFVSRWEHIQIAATHPVLAALGSVTRKQVPQLKSLAIQAMQVMTFHSQPENDEPPWTSCDILRAPHLRHFAASTSAYRHLSIPPLWSDLRSLDISNRSRIVHPRNNAEGLLVAEVLALLRQNPRLQYGKFQLGRLSFIGTLEPTVFRHDSLETLILIGGYELSSFTTLSRYASFPQLRHLRCSFRMNSRETADARNFLATSTLLESIDINCDFFTRESLEEFLRDVPLSFTTLNLRPACYQHDSRVPSAVVDDALLRALSDPHQPLAPTLQNLELSYSAEVSDEALLDFVRTKMGHGGALKPLRHLSVLFRRRLEQDILPDLQVFSREQGLDVELRYQQPVRQSFSPWKGLERGKEEQLYIIPSEPEGDA